MNMCRRDIALGLIAGVTGAALIPAVAVSAEAVTEATARAAITAWLDALATHDPATVARVLAPEFQIMRSDGSGYDSKSYLDHLPDFKGTPDIRDLAFGANGDLLVTRYNLDVAQKINGKPVQTLAPRLSVFRHDGERWLIVGHANFAQIG